MNFSKITFLLITIILLSCNKNDNGRIPLVNVNIRIYTTDPDFQKVSTTGGWEYITGGSRGIVIYRKSSYEFVAFERHCPYKPDDACGQVEVDASDVVLEDKCCGSKFIITDGSIINGPSEIPLKQYQTTFDGQVLRVFN